MALASHYSLTPCPSLSSHCRAILKSYHRIYDRFPFHHLANVPRPFPLSPYLTTHLLELHQSIILGDHLTSIVGRRCPFDDHTTRQKAPLQTVRKPNHNPVLCQL